MRTNDFKENPVWIREMIRQGRPRRKWACPFWTGMAVTMLAIPAFSLAVTAAAHGGSEAAREVLHGSMIASGFLMMLYLVFKSVSRTYSSISIEREQGTFEPLIATLLEPSEIIEGKLMGNIYDTLREVLVLSPVLILLNTLGKMELWRSVLEILFFVVIVYLFGIIGVYASVSSSSSKEAQDKATGLVALIILGTPFVDLLISSFFRPFAFIPIALTLNPAAAMYSIVCESGRTILWVWSAIWIFTIPVYALLILKLKQISIARLARISNE